MSVTEQHEEQGYHTKHGEGRGVCESGALEGVRSYCFLSDTRRVTHIIKSRKILSVTEQHEEQGHHTKHGEGRGVCESGALEGVRSYCFLSDTRSVTHIIKSAKVLSVTEENKNTLKREKIHRHLPYLMYRNNK